MFLTRKPSSPAGFWTTKVLVAAILSIAATTAEAQDAPAPAAQPAAAAAAPAQPNPGVPQPEWEKVCGTVKEQQECHISRRRVAATGQALAQFMIIERGDKKLIQIAVPPVALIQPGVQVKIDENQSTGVKFVVCTPGECLALGEIKADFVAGLKKGNNLIVTMLNPQGKPVAFDISLSGFTASYDGPGLNPAEAQARQQKLEDELKRKADAARQQLLNAQQQTTTTQ
ncbi:MAG: invasion associated locus B family protein [Rhizobiales bacterium]|nr:invasion associated locus B family protein [Hyphomicrobiales bacterium]